MAKKDNFSQETANEVFEAAALAAFKKFGFNPTMILSFEMSPASDLYISPKLPGAQNWFYLKHQKSEDALVYNLKTGEVLLVEGEGLWSEKTQTKMSKISAGDRKVWMELTGKELPAVEKAPAQKAAKPAKAKKPVAKAKAKKAPAKKKPAKKAAAKRK